MIELILSLIALMSSDEKHPWWHRDDVFLGHDDIGVLTAKLKLNTSAQRCNQEVLTGLEPTILRLVPGIDTWMKYETN